MDRLGFFKQGLSSMLDVAGSIVGLKHAANSFVEVVDEALSNIKTDIGLHLPSLDAGMYDDPQGTLSEVAHIGYTMVEVGAYYGGKIHNMAPEEFKALVNKAGLKITSAHINHLHQSAEDSTAGTFTNSADAEAAKRAARWAAMASGATEEGATAEEGITKEVVAEEVATEGTTAEGTEEAKEVAAEDVKAVEVKVVEVTEKADTTAEDTEAKPDPNDEWWREALDIHKELGCRYIVMSRLPDYPTDEVIAEYATYFNRIGELAAERGMQFCYHPRQQEMKVTDGKSAFETIAANTDPEKVHFEIDTYEATEAEVDVEELLKRLTKRVTLLHIHDHGIIGDSEKIDFEKIIAQGIRTGVKDIFVEVRNFSLPPINCVERSYYNVESLPSISY
ncbi:MAG: TIM barrel protein [Alistipes sp.]|nr:TIM barrel protein [Alistipes sp.]